ncbi:MAG: hypothetical protein JWM28_571 [Chitinophagaceae bacterium]|nr:hypothetical protein [Chitinophagaceae bacterium]
MNLYTYVGDDPCNKTDPSGTSVVAPLIFIGIVVGAIYMSTDSADKGMNATVNEYNDKMEAEINGVEYVPPPGPSGADLLKASTLFAKIGTEAPKGIPKDTKTAVVQAATKLLKASKGGEDKKENQKENKDATNKNTKSERERAVREKEQVRIRNRNGGAHCD